MAAGLARAAGVLFAATTSLTSCKLQVACKSNSLLNKHANTLLGAFDFNILKEYLNMPSAGPHAQYICMTVVG